jgi:hypothetical protein
MTSIWGPSFGGTTGSPSNPTQAGPNPRALLSANKNARFRRNEMMPPMMGDAWGMPPWAMPGNQSPIGRNTPSPWERENNKGRMKQKGPRNWGEVPNDGISGGMPKQFTEMPMPRMGNPNTGFGGPSNGINLAELLKRRKGEAQLHGQPQQPFTNPSRSSFGRNIAGGFFGL